MNRTYVVLAFFIAALFVGVMLRFTDLSGGIETFRLPRDDMAPLDTETVAVESSPHGISSPLLETQAKPIPERPYEIADDTALGVFMNNKIGPECCPSPFSSDAGCICLSQTDIQNFASRFGNNSRSS